MQRVSGMETVKCFMIAEYRHTGPCREVMGSHLVCQLLLDFSCVMRRPAVRNVFVQLWQKGRRSWIVISIDHLGVFIGSTVTVQYRTRNRLGEEQCWLLGVRAPKIKFRFWLACMSQLNTTLATQPAIGTSIGGKDQNQCRQQRGQVSRCGENCGNHHFLQASCNMLQVRKLGFMSMTWMGRRQVSWRALFWVIRGFAIVTQIFNFKRCPILADHSDTRT